VGDLVKNLRESVFVELFRTYVPAETVEEQWDVASLEKAPRDDWGVDQPLVKTLEAAQSIEDEDLLNMVQEAAEAVYEGKVAQVGRESFAGFERSVMLQSLDTHWREHLAALDMLRQGIHLRGYAQKNPKQEYKREAFELFASMLDAIKLEVTQVLMTVQVRSESDVEAVEAAPAPENVQYHHADYEEALAPSAETHENQLAEEHKPFVRESHKVGRNDLCPCGSGKKYKQCHGKLS